MDLLRWLIPLMALAAAALWSIMFASILARRPFYGVHLLLMAGVINAILISDPQLEIGGYSLTLWDVVCILLVMGLAIGSTSRLNTIRFPIVLGLFAVSIALSIMRGVLTFGIEPAIVDARGLIHFTVVLAFGCTVVRKQDDLSRLLRLWLAYSGALLLLALSRWAIGALGLEIANTWEDLARTSGGSDGYRVLQAAETMQILIAALISVCFWVWSRQREWTAKLFFLLVPLLIVLQHRTIWVVGGCMIIALVFARGSIRSISRRILLLLGFAVVCSSAAVWLTRNPNQLRQDIEASASNVGTWNWRVESWRTLLGSHQMDGMDRWLFGAPMGSGWDRVMYGLTVEVSPHNFYVYGILRVGLVGLFLLLALYITAWLSLARVDTVLRVTCRGVIIAQLIYFMTYSPSPALGLIVGASIGIGYRLRSQFSQALEEGWTPTSSPFGSYSRGELR